MALYTLTNSHQSGLNFKQKSFLKIAVVGVYNLGDQAGRPAMAGSFGFWM